MPVSDTSALRDATILIIDDDRDVLLAMETAFRAEGADTYTAGDGNAAIRLTHELKPDLVVLDMMLPARSGFLALEKIKGNDDSPLVIMVTANDGKRHQAYAQSLGVDAYLIKPVPLGQLMETAAGLLAGRS
ncbi:MAG: response regulator [Phycisphaeraceae bacterium]|nr:response regulator [Phycisphaeraceae bacterium]